MKTLFIINVYYTDPKRQWGYQYCDTFNISCNFI